MKLSFSKKIAVKLLFPFFLTTLVLFAAFFVAFYYFSPQNPFERLPRQHIMGLLSGKRLAVDMFFEQGKKSVEYLARRNIIRETIALRYSPAASLIVLEDMVSSSPCKTFALLSRDGKVISSTSGSLKEGSDWSGKDFFIDSIAGSQSPAVRVFYSQESGIVFLASVFDAKGMFTGLIYAIPDNKRLSKLLRTDTGAYKTEKVELINAAGDAVPTINSVPDKRIKFNIPGNGKDNVVQMRGDVLFDVVSLRNAPFRLMATIEKTEIMRPLNLVFTLIAIFAGLLLLIFLIYTIYYAPKFVSGPFDKFANPAEAAAGDVSPAEPENNKSGSGRVSPAETPASLPHFAQKKLAYDLQPFKVCELLNEIEAYARRLVGDKEIEVIVDCEEVLADRVVDTDRSLLKRMLLNLVHQSAMNTSVGTITILATGEMKDGADHIVVSIADTGKGFSDKELDESSEFFVGQEIAEMLGGYIERESVAGKGSLFTAVVPVKAAS